MSTCPCLTRHRIYTRPQLLDGDLKFQRHKPLPKGWRFEIADIPVLRVGLRINCIVAFFACFSGYTIVVCPLQRSMKLINCNSTYKLIFPRSVSSHIYILVKSLSLVNAIYLNLISASPRAQRSHYFLSYKAKRGKNVDTT